MSNFTSFTHFNRVDGTYKEYVLGADLIWNVGGKHSNLPLVITKNTTFDISVPKLLEWFIDPHDPNWLLQAAVHDECLKRGFGALRASIEWYCASRAKKRGYFKSIVSFFATWFYVAYKRIVR